MPRFFTLYRSYKNENRGNGEADSVFHEVRKISPEFSIGQRIDATQTMFGFVKIGPNQKVAPKQDENDCDQLIVT